MDTVFYFKQFSVHHQNSTMKVGTDAVLLGAITDIGKAKNILDVGTGSGVIALMLAQRSDASIHAIDPDKPSIKEAGENFKASSWEERLSAENITIQNFAESNNPDFDLIVTNPPYFTNALKNPDASKAQARHNDNLSFDELIRNASQLLNSQGKLALILPASEEQSILHIAFTYKLFPNQITYILPREDKSPNRIVLELSKQETSGKLFSQTLSIRNKTGEYSPEYIALLKNFLLYF